MSMYNIGFGPADESGFWTNEGYGTSSVPGGNAPSDVWDIIWGTDIDTYDPMTNQKGTFRQPSYFKNLSPMALSYVKQLFPDWKLEENVGNTKNAIPYGTTVSGQYKKGVINPLTGKEDVPLEEEETLWARPEISSAQSQRKLQSSGAWNALQEYLQLAGEQVKNDWLAEMQTLLPSQTKRQGTTYNIPRR